MFVDATFDTVPQPFYECLIIMIFDVCLKIFIPVAWILMSGKTDECYWQYFSWLCLSMEDLDPAFCGFTLKLLSFAKWPIILLVLITLVV